MEILNNGKPKQKEGDVYHNIKETIDSIDYFSFVGYVDELIYNEKIVRGDDSLYNKSIFCEVLNSLSTKRDVVSIHDIYHEVNILVDSDANKLNDSEMLTNSLVEVETMISIYPYFNYGFQCNNGNISLVSNVWEHTMRICEYCRTIYNVDSGFGIYCCCDCSVANDCEAAFTQQVRERNQIQYQSITQSVLYNDDSSETVNLNGTDAIVYSGIKDIDKSRHMFSTPQGHGFAAEEVNTLIDIYQGKDAEVIGYDNQKSGADRLVDGRLIQTKYYKTANGSISACFDNGTYKYLKSNGKPMQVEIPADQYARGLELMKERIRNGEVPGIKDPKYASKLVRKGHVTYAQAKAAAEFGTIESITMDVGSGLIQVGNTAGMTVAMQLAISCWNGESLDTSLKKACDSLVSVGGKTLAISTISSQLLRTGVGNSIRNTAGLIVKESGELVFTKATANMLSNIAKNNIVTGMVTMTIMNLGNINKALSDEMSGRELVNKLGSSAVGLGAGVLGAEIIGSALGTFIPIPIVGTLVGGAVGSLIGGFFGNVIFNTEKYEKERAQREDAKRAEERRIIEVENTRIREFLDVLSNQLGYWSQIYLLNEDEIQNIVTMIERGDSLGYMDPRSAYLQMAKSSNGYVAEATIYLRKLIVDVVSKRKVVGVIGEEQLGEALIQYIDK